MDVDLSTDLSALDELFAPLLETARPRDRLPPRPRRHGDTRGKARADLSLLQPVAAHAPRRRLLRRPMRLQGRAARGDPGAAARRRGRQLVLRHRAPLCRPAQRVRHPRGSRALGRRSRLPRRHSRHRARGSAWDQAAARSRRRAGFALARPTAASVAIGAARRVAATAAPRVSLSRLPAPAVALPASRASIPA